MIFRNRELLIDLFISLLFCPEKQRCGSTNPFINRILTGGIGHGHGCKGCKAIFNLTHLKMILKRVKPNQRQAEMIKTILEEDLVRLFEYELKIGEEGREDYFLKVIIKKRELGPYYLMREPIVIRSPDGIIE